MSIHHSAIVHPDAKIGADVKIGPFCTVGANVVLGDRVELVSNVVIDGKTVIGDDTAVYPFAVLGAASQDLKYQSEETMTGLRIGKRNKIREYATIHTGTPASTGTEIGDDCQIMVNSHVGHDCKVGNGVVLSNLVQLAGHVEVENSVIISAGSMIHQFCRVGRNAFVAGMSGITMDVPPYSIFEGKPAMYRTINKVGLLRHGFTHEDLHAVHKVYSVVFAKEPSPDLVGAIKRLRKEINGNKYALDALDFIENRSKRGAHRGEILKDSE